MLYLVRPILYNLKDVNYEIFYNVLSLHPRHIQILLSATCLQAPSIYMLPLILKSPVLTASGICFTFNSFGIFPQKVFVFLSTLRVAAITTLNSVNRRIFIMETRYVFCEVGTVFLNIIQTDLCLLVHYT